MEHWISGSFSILNSKIPEHYKHTNHTSSFSSAESSCLKDLELFVTVPKSSWTKTLASDQTIRVSWTHLVLPKSEDLAKLRCFGGFLCHLLLPLRAIHSSWLIHVCYQRGGGKHPKPATCYYPKFDGNEDANLWTFQQLPFFPILWHHFPSGQVTLGKSSEE